ncbi:hypothetical protein [Aureimonas sp. ME7]|uniref:hypothetical protein n=1 Tax=Aureimonas sp. ME7 TaxID=2744252 RepID=UPI0015F4C1B2|nr:hypothetical protein [Aureimonas sp. ME7]
MQVPPLPDAVMALVLLGFLFLLRFHLSMRRIWSETGLPEGRWIERYRAPTRPMSFGRALEPNRRHAVRQLVVALVCLALAFVLGVWLGLGLLLGW